MGKKPPLWLLCLAPFLFPELIEEVDAGGCPSPSCPVSGKFRQRGSCTPLSCDPPASPASLTRLHFSVPGRTCARSRSWGSWGCCSRVCRRSPALSRCGSRTAGAAAGARATTGGRCSPLRLGLLFVGGKTTPSPQQRQGSEFGAAAAAVEGWGQPPEHPSCSSGLFWEGKQPQ